MNDDAIDLKPLPMPAAFKSDMDRPVPFDADAIVSLDCPDAEAAPWLSRHFAEWFGGQAPKIVAAAPGSRHPAPSSPLPTTNSPEAYAIAADSAGVRIAARSLAGVHWAAFTLLLARCPLF